MSQQLKIGPQELYLFPEHLNECYEVLKHDDESSVKWFVDYQENKYNLFKFQSPSDFNQLFNRIEKRVKAVIETQKSVTHIFKDGDGVHRNLLMLSAWSRNLTLTKFLITHLHEKKVINMKDESGRTALGWMCGPGASHELPENAVECVKIFLANGAEVNVPCMPWRHGVPLYDVNGEYDRPETVAGRLLSRWVEYDSIVDKEKNPKWGKIKKQLEIHEAILTLFLERGAACHVDGLGQVGIHSVIDETDPWETRCQKLLTPVKEKVFWSKMRLMILAFRSDGSPLKNWINNDCMTAITSLFIEIMKY